MPNAKVLKLDALTSLGVWGPGLDLGDAPDVRSCFTSDRPRPFKFPSLNSLAISSRAEAVPYFIAQFSTEDLERVKEVVFKLTSVPKDSIHSEPSPLNRTVYFSQLMDLKLTLDGPGSSQFDWCLRFFNFSAATGRVDIDLFEWDTSILGDVVLEFPHAQTMSSGSLDELWHVKVPSLRLLELQGLESHYFHGGVRGMHSRATFLKIENLRIGRVVGLPTVFSDERVAALFPNVRRLILDISSHFRTQSLNPGVFFPRRFHKLEILQLDYTLEGLSDHTKDILALVSLFNARKGQRIKRVELHGPKSMLAEGEVILRKSLPRGAQLQIVEVTAPNPQDHPWFI